jgi:hypothetical protein
LEATDAILAYRPAPCKPRSHCPKIALPGHFWFAAARIKAAASQNTDFLAGGDNNPPRNSEPRPERSGVRTCLETVFNGEKTTKPCEEQTARSSTQASRWVLHEAPSVSGLSFSCSELTYYHDYTATALVSPAEKAVFLSKKIATQTGFVVEAKFSECWTLWRMPLRGVGYTVLISGGSAALHPRLYSARTQTILTRSASEAHNPFPRLRFGLSMLLAQTRRKRPR